MKLFDAHCHLQDPKLDATRALVRARERGVYGFSCCATEPSDWVAVRDLAASEPGVFPSYGVHPWFLEDLPENWLDDLTELVAHNGCGIGEIGLDHGLKTRDDQTQEAVFSAQLALSQALRLPVSIHCRKAWGRLLDLLHNFGPHPRGMLIHSYSGSHELVGPLSKLGAFFSFSGTLTFHRNKRAHKALQAVPLTRLLIETDAPDMLPVIPGLDKEARKHTPNEPANLVWVAEQAARLKDLSVTQLAQACWSNAQRLFCG